MQRLQVWVKAATERMPQLQLPARPGGGQDESEEVEFIYNRIAGQSDDEGPGQCPRPAECLPCQFSGVGMSRHVLAVAQKVSQGSGPAKHGVSALILRSQKQLVATLQQRNVV